MKAFYYCDSNGLKILENLEIKISSPTEFNDPFEFYTYPDNPKPTIEDFRRNDAFQQASYGMFYFICLSENEENPRMWAQYADNHKGMMIEFDLSQKPFSEFSIKNRNLIRVNYSDGKRVPLSMFKSNPIEMFYQLAEKKGKYWEQEEEMRIMIADDWIDGEKLEGRELVQGDRLLRLLKISEESILSVTLGLRRSEELITSVRRLLETRFSKAKLYQACRHSNGFTIVRNHLDLKNR